MLHTNYLRPRNQHRPAVSFRRGAWGAPQFQFIPRKDVVIVQAQELVSCRGPRCLVSRLRALCGLWRGPRRRGRPKRDPAASDELRRGTAKQRVRSGGVCSHSLRGAASDVWRARMRARLRSVAVPWLRRRRHSSTRSKRGRRGVNASCARPSRTFPTSSCFSGTKTLPLSVPWNKHTEVSSMLIRKTSFVVGTRPLT